jgi:hypothetical protein
MKKLFFVLALVAVSGVSMAMTSGIVSKVENSKASIVAVDDKTDKSEKETKSATTETKAKGEGCGTAKSAGCGDKAKSGCGEKAKAECETKKEGTK